MQRQRREGFRYGVPGHGQEGTPDRHRRAERDIAVVDRAERHGKFRAQRNHENQTGCHDPPPDGTPGIAARCFFLRRARNEDKSQRHPDEKKQNHEPAPPALWGRRYQFSATSRMLSAITTDGM